MKKIRITSTTKNSKELRLEIYKAMLAFIKEKVDEACYGSGFCFAIKTVTGILHNSDSEFNFYRELNAKTVYKELECYKPPENEFGSYWFYTDEKGTKKRIKILEKIIKEMEK
jgi:hypothetical protein